MGENGLKTSLQLKVLDALVHMHAAVKNVQMYAADSPVIENSIERLYLYFLDILREESPLIFAESDQQATVCGDFIMQKDQGTAHVQFLLDTLFNFGLESITFEKGLIKNELDSFITLIARKPEHLHHLGGLAKLMKDSKIVHIRADKKTLTLFLNDDRETDDADQSLSETVSQTPDSENDPISDRIAEILKALRRIKEMEEGIESFVSEEQRERINQLLAWVIGWLERETNVTPSYKQTKNSMHNLIHGFIGQGFFAEANAAISVLDKIKSGSLPKNAQIKETVAECLQHLTSEDNIDFLFKEINVNEKNKTADAFELLSFFGEDLVIRKLLDTVRNAKDSKERIRIIHIIREMGRKAIPAIKENITMDAPWYFLRNMAYILGRIGNENSADSLKPLMIHKDKRVRMEALKSVCLTGGSKKGAILLSVLPGVDAELKLHIVETLGKIKHTEAIPVLQDMLKNKSAMSKEAQISLQGKICDALGSIGSPLAIPILTEIVESKSFLGIGGAYPTEVKHAAERALNFIKRKL
jgi:HEAT repeat protein